MICVDMYACSSHHGGQNIASDLPKFPSMQMENYTEHRRIIHNRCKQKLCR